VRSGHVMSGYVKLRQFTSGYHMLVHDRTGYFRLRQVSSG